MKILELKWKNFGAYGNAEQHLDFSGESALNLLYGHNGAGKCVSPDTEIDIAIINDDLNVLFTGFLERDPTI